MTPTCGYGSLVESARTSPSRPQALLCAAPDGEHHQDEDSTIGMPHSDPSKTPIQDRVESAAANALEELAVSYTVKELLAQISESVVKIDTKLDAKASVEYAASIEANCERVAERHDARIKLLEDYRSRLFGAMAVIGFVAGGGGVGLAQLLG